MLYEYFYSMNVYIIFMCSCKYVCIILKMLVILILLIYLTMTWHDTIIFDIPIIMVIKPLPVYNECSECVVMN